VAGHRRPAGTVRLRVRVDGGRPLPDPRSAWQPRGVHGPSRTFDASRYHWSDDGWPARVGAGVLGAVVYELHVGTFTPRAPSTPPTAGSTTSSRSASTSSS
jgi:maltooligosyltrehalose trehalohydrolase